MDSARRTQIMLTLNLNDVGGRRCEHWSGSCHWPDAGWVPSASWPASGWLAPLGRYTLANNTTGSRAPVAHRSTTSNVCSTQPTAPSGPWVHKKSAQQHRPRLVQQKAHRTGLHSRMRLIHGCAGTLKRCYCANTLWCVGDCCRSALIVYVDIVLSE